MKIGKFTLLAAATVALFGFGHPAHAQDQTIADVAMSDNQFSTLVKAVKAAGLAETLKSEGPFTLFAPTNAAFAKIPKAKLNALLKDKAKLKMVLLYHVVPGKIMASDVMAMKNPSMPKTAAGPMLRVKTTAPIMVNNARVIKADIETSNGVIHVIDTVLMPMPGKMMMGKHKMMSKPKM